MIKRIVLTVLFFFILAFRAQAEAPRKLTVFYSPGCHACIKAKEELLKDVEKDFSGQVSLDYRDIGDIENYKLFLSLKEEYAQGAQLNVPVFFWGGRLFAAEGLDKAKFYALLKQGQGKLQAMGSRTVDLQEYLKSFKPLAVVGAGLVDGINPCAFTVIVFFVSFLALQGYRKRELFAIGLTFILAVFITYLLIGLGLFNFLYRIRSFWAVAKAVNIGIGLLSILLGFLAVADFIKYRKSKDTENMFLQLPKVIKERIHSVIGGHYRRLKTGGGSPAKTLLGLMLSALITGFLVSLLEAVCTGQLYLPTIAFVIKSGSLSARAVFYLLLYNLMFILPLAAIFLFALFGATSNEFSKFLKKHLGSIKILMSLMFFGLGILLLWRG